MAELMLVNPRRRRAKTKRRTTRKAVARRAPVRRAPARRSPARRVRRRRNPVARGGVMNNMLGQVMPAATAASGALALDLAWGYMPLPVMVKTGPLRHVFKGIGAVLMGALAQNVVKKSTANQFTAGALTVVMHNAAREAMGQMLPGVPLGYYSAGYPVGVGEYTEGMGAYVDSNGASTYLAQDTLSKPFANSNGGACPVESENMGMYSNYY